MGKGGIENEDSIVSNRQKIGTRTHQLIPKIYWFCSSFSLNPFSENLQGSPPRWHLGGALLVHNMALGAGSGTCSVLVSVFPPIGSAYISVTVSETFSENLSIETKRVVVEPPHPHVTRFSKAADTHQYHAWHEVTSHQHTHAYRDRIYMTRRY